MENEIFKKIFNDLDYFEISNLGRIRSMSREIKIRGKHKGFVKTKFLSFGIDKNGYERIPLLHNGKRKTYKVHRLVAIAFLPNPELKPQVNHINGIKNDNRTDNLEWCTAKENINHAFRLGLKTGNERDKNGMSKINTKQIKEITSLIGYTHKEISLKYGVTRSCISTLIRKAKQK